MKYLSVCSGIEAATVAWHGFGWTPVAFAEVEAFPSAVLAHHYPTVPNLGDLTRYREWPEELLVEVDLLVGGTPCQAFSVAGLRRSLDDERGNLSLTYVNLFHHINEVRKRHGRSPAIALWENVPGVLSTKDNAFGCFIGGLLGCDEAPETESGKWDKAGFLSSETVRVGYRVLDAQYFGVAQRRRRVFLVAVPCELVASLGERACPSEILSLRESVLGNPPTRGAKGESITSSPQGIAGNVSSKWSKGTGGPAGDECYNPIAFGGQMSTPQVDIELSQTLQRKNPQAVAMTFDWQAGGGGSDKSFRGKSRSYIVDKPGSTRALTSCKTLAVAVDLQNVTAGGDLAGTLDTTRPSRGGGQAVAFTKSKRAQSVTDDESLVPGSVAPTQNQFDQGDTRATTVVACNNTGAGWWNEPEDVAATLRRECDRASVMSTTVIGFDGFQSGNPKATHQATTEGTGPLIRNRPHCVATLMAVRRLTPRECERLQGFPDDYTLVTYRGKPAADGPRYRALGNSMAVPCMWWLGLRIQKATSHD